MPLHGPDNNNINFNTTELISQLHDAISALSDVLNNGSIRLDSASEEYKKIINEVALKMSGTFNDLDSQCKVLAETLVRLNGITESTNSTIESLQSTTESTLESLQSATNATIENIQSTTENTANTLNELAEAIKQTIASSDTLQPLMDNLTDLNSKIQELNESISNNIGQAINITQTANSTSGTATGVAGAVTGGNTTATNIINIIQGGQGKGQGGQNATGIIGDKQSKWAGFVDNIVSSMVTGFENSKFGKISLAGIIRDAVALVALLIGNKFGPVFGLIAGFTGILATKFIGNFLTTLAGLKIAKWGGMSKEALANLPVKGISGNLAKSVSLNGWKATLSSAGGWLSKFGSGVAKVWGWLNKILNLPVFRVLGKVLGVIGVILSAFDIFKGVKRVQAGDKAGGWDIAGGVAGIVSAIGFMLIPVLGPIGIAVGIIGALLAGLFKWLGGRAKKKDKDNAEIIKGLNKEEKDNYWDKDVAGRITNGSMDGTGNGGSVGARKIGGAGTTSALGGNYAITSGVGYRWINGKKEWHQGVDIGIPEGKKFKSSIYGEVVKTNTGYNGGYGNNVIIKDALGNYHQFSHMKDISVKEGQFVTPETFLGTSGKTGRAFGAHVDYKIFKNGKLDSRGYATGEAIGSKADPRNPLDYIRSEDFRASQGRYVLDNIDNFAEVKNCLTQIIEELRKNNINNINDAKSSDDLKKLSVLETKDAYQANPQSQDYSGNSLAMRAFITNLTSLLGMK